MRFLLILIGAGALVTPALAASSPVFDRTAAGDAAATASLITSKDLPKPDWTEVTAATNSGFAFSCSGYDPSVRGVTEIGAASSPDFYAGGSDSVQVLQMSNVYASPSQASTVWRQSVKAGLVRCAVETLDGLTQKGIDVKLISEGALAVGKAGPMTRAYRVVADLYYPSTKSLKKVYFDVILVGRKSTLSEITLSSFGVPVPSKVEYALALIVYHAIG